MQIRSSTLSDSPLSIGMYDGAHATIEDSLLTDGRNQPTLTVWATYGGPVSVDRNSFIVSDAPAVKLQYSDGSAGVGVQGNGNYLFSPTLPFSELIVDREDDLQVLDIVSLTGARATPSPTAPQPADADLLREIAKALPFANEVVHPGTEGDDLIRAWNKYDGDMQIEVVEGGAGVDTFVHWFPRENMVLFGTAASRSMFYQYDLYQQPKLLHDIERIELGGGSLAFDLDGRAGTVARLIGTVFGAAAVANEEYVGIGLREADGGASLQALASLALGAAGLGSPDLLVSSLWENVFGDAPSHADKAPFLDMLAAGTPAADLVLLAAGTTFVAEAIDLVGLQENGLPYF